MIPDLGGGFFLRRATSDDHPALCKVCVATGDAGKDATSREDDPELMGQIYAVPYQVLGPDLAFVIDGPSGVAGYLFGVLDTASFNARLASDWFPALRRRVVDPGPDRPTWQGSDWVRHAIHHPDLDIPGALVDFPSHGHIDLLPEARGLGIGRRCMTFLEQQLTDAGSRGLFLDVHPRNVGAQRFYAALGYAPLAVPKASATSMFMAKRLTP